MVFSVYVVRLGLFLGVALLNLGIVLWLFCKALDNQSSRRVAVDIIRSALFLLVLAALLRVW